ncbi:MAG TPA: hypothetical protein VET86_03130, partial [Casimicrobiaceae bacterium]|nr:hypothetical protein [Casimicrobiaceae bacterium]
MTTLNKRILLGALAAGLAIAPLSAAFADGGHGRYGGSWHGGHARWSHGGYGHGHGYGYAWTVFGAAAAVVGAAAAIVTAPIAL